MRQFVVQLQEHLFARHLRRPEPRGHIGDLVLGEQPRSLGQPGGDETQQVGGAVTGARADHEHALVEAERADLGGEGQQNLMPHGIDLVDRRHRAAALGQQPLGDIARGVVEPMQRVDHQNDFVGIAGAVPRGADHGALEAALGRENAGRIDEHHLGRAHHGDPHDPGARRLYFGRDDRDLAAHQLVDQGRLADIGRADDRHQAATA